MSADRHLRLLPTTEPHLDDLRDPLHCIAGFSELLAAPGADLGPAEREWAQAIAASAAEMVRALELYAASEGS